VQGKGTADIRSRPGLTNQFSRWIFAGGRGKGDCKMSRSAQLTGIIRPDLSAHGISLDGQKIERSGREIPLRRRLDSVFNGDAP
jgi:hypothetical protein